FNHKPTGTDHLVSIIDTVTNTFSARISLGQGFTEYPAFSPDGTRLYVPISLSPNAIKVVDLAARAVVATIPLSGVAISAALDAPRNRLYVAGYDSGTVTVIDTVSNTI